MSSYSEALPELPGARLYELRRRLIIALVAVLPGATLGWAYAPQLLDLALLPYVRAHRRLGLGPAMVHLRDPIDQLTAYVHIAVVCGVLLGVPVIAWQLWCFLMPSPREGTPRGAVPFALAAMLSFSIGALFGFSLVFPMTFETLLALSGSIGSVRVQPTIMLGEYLRFAGQMLLAFGLVFEVPVVVIALAALRLVDYRQYLAFGRWWVLASSILGALLTPPDVASQIMVFVPLVALYYAGVGVAYLIR